MNISEEKVVVMKLTWKNGKTEKCLLTPSSVLALSYPAGG